MTVTTDLIAAVLVDAKKEVEYLRGDSVVRAGSRHAVANELCMIVGRQVLILELLEKLYANEESNINEDLTSDGQTPDTD